MTAIDITIVPAMRLVSSSIRFVSGAVLSLGKTNHPGNTLPVREQYWGFSDQSGNCRIPRGCTPGTA